MLVCRNLPTSGETGVEPFFFSGLYGLIRQI